MAAISQLQSHLDSCSVENKNVKKAIKATVVEAKNPNMKNTSTFTCPFCKMANLDREKIVKHMQTQHPRKPGVCPICANEPHGDPNYVS